LPKPVAEAVLVEPAKRTTAQKQIVARHYRDIAPSLEPQRKRIAELRSKRLALEKRIPTTLVSMSVPAREMRILPRGNSLDDSGDVVAPAVPAFLPPLDATERRATRLDLARWLVSADHPLVARVFVNRLWKLFVGAGLVR